MKIYRDISQGDPEWMKLRIASIGGSGIGDAVAKGEGKTRNQLMCDFIEEIINEEKKEGFVSWDMKEGILYEPFARDAYRLRTGHKVEEVALVKHSEHKHYSPDGLINPDGLIEIKRAKLSVFIEFDKNKKISTGRRKQMQWGMRICERKWCDYVMYCPYIEKKADPLRIVRVSRDEKEIKELDEGANRFIEEMQNLFVRVMKGG